MRVLVTLLALVTAPFLASVSQEPAGSPSRTGNDAVRHAEAGNVEDQDNDDGDGHCWSGEHPSLGRVTLRQLLAAWVVHDLGHLAQTARVMAKQYRDEVGPWVPFLPVLTDHPVPRS